MTLWLGSFLSNGLEDVLGSSQVRSQIMILAPPRTLGQKEASFVTSFRYNGRQTRRKQGVGSVVLVPAGHGGTWNVFITALPVLNKAQRKKTSLHVEMPTAAKLLDRRKSRSHSPAIFFQNVPSLTPIFDHGLKGSGLMTDCPV